MTMADRFRPRMGQTRCMSEAGSRRRAHWVVRAGDENRLVDEFIDSGVIGVGYGTLPDGRDLTYTAVRRLLVAEATSEALDRHTSMFIEFVQEISIGHIILMPDTPRREMVMGDVTGPYEFHADLRPERCRHRRTVEWFGRVPLADLPTGRRQALPAAVDADSCVDPRARGVHRSGPCRRDRPSRNVEDSCHGAGRSTTVERGSQAQAGGGDP